MESWRDEVFDEMSLFWVRFLAVSMVVASAIFLFGAFTELVPAINGSGASQFQLWFFVIMAAIPAWGVRGVLAELRRRASDQGWPDETR